MFFPCLTPEKKVIVPEDPIEPFYFNSYIVYLRLIVHLFY